MKEILKFVSEKDGFRTYELIKDSTFTEMFDSLLKERDKLCLLKINKEENVDKKVQDFIEIYPDLFRKKDKCSWVFFLIQQGNEFFVAFEVMCDDESFVVFAPNLDYVGIWFALRHHYLVVPQWLFV